MTSGAHTICMHVYNLGKGGIRSPGVVTNSINMTCVCSVGALVVIWKNNQGHFVMAKSHLTVNRHNSVALCKFSTQQDILTQKKRSLHSLRSVKWTVFYPALPTFTTKQEIMILLIYTCTYACFSISIKSIFARAVVGSPGVVTHSINITPVCSFYTLVYIWSNRKTFHWH